MGVKLGLPDSAAHNFMRLLSGTALGQVLMIAATPVISRLYGPEALGQFAVVLSFVAMVSISVSLRFELAVVSELDDSVAKTLLTLSLLLSVPMSLLWGGVFLAVNRLGVAGFDGISAWSAVAVVAMLVVTGWFSALRYWHVRAGEFGVVGRSQVANGAGRALLPVLAGFVRADWIGLLAGELAGRWLGIFRLWRALAVRLSWRDVSRPALRTMMSRNWKYPLILLPSSVLDAFAQNLAVPALASVFGLGVAGQYALVNRLALAPASLIGTSAADVFHWEMRAATGADRRRSLWRYAGRLLLIAIAIYLPIALLAPWLTVPVFGEAWADAGMMLTLLAPAYVAMFVVSPLSRALLLANRIELKLVADVACLVIPFAALFALADRGLWIALAGYGVGTCCAYIIYFGVIVYVVSAGRADGS
jgi:O-antigen/teichoic acid export membrane protein